MDPGAHEITEHDPAQPGGCGLASGYAALFLGWYVGVSALVGWIAGYDFVTSAAGLSVLVISVGLGGVWIGDRLRRALSWTPVESWALTGRPGARIQAAAALGGLSLGVLGGWFAERLGPPLKEALHWPAGNDALSTLGGALTDGPVAGRLLFMVVVVLIGPLFEELIFRGILWRTLQKRGAVITVLGTSLAFALYHADPTQVIGVLPLALFLGVLRQASGSLLPCLLAHAVNNGLATLLALTAGMDTPTPGPLAAFAAVVATIAFGLAAWGGRRAS